MKKIKEYDIAYICYYSEKIELSEISVGFDSKLSTKRISCMIKKLKDTSLFDFYKNTYEELLEFDD